MIGGIFRIWVWFTKTVLTWPFSTWSNGTPSPRNTPQSNQRHPRSIQRKEAQFHRNNRTPNQAPWLHHQQG